MSDVLSQGGELNESRRSEADAEQPRQQVRRIFSAGFLRWSSSVPNVHDDCSVRTASGGVVEAGCDTCRQILSLNDGLFPYF